MPASSRAGWCWRWTCRPPHWRAGARKRIKGAFIGVHGSTGARQVFVVHGAAHRIDGAGQQRPELGGLGLGVPAAPHAPALGILAVDVAVAVVQCLIVHGPGAARRLGLLASVRLAPAIAPVTEPPEGGVPVAAKVMEPLA